MKKKKDGSGDKFSGPIKLAADAMAKGCVDGNVIPIAVIGINMACEPRVLPIPGHEATIQAWIREHSAAIVDLRNRLWAQFVKERTERN